MSFTDTHTHLYLEQFKDDLDTVIENAISCGVNRLFFPAINSNYTDLMIDLKKQLLKKLFLIKIFRLGKNEIHIQF